MSLQGRINEVSDYGTHRCVYVLVGENIPVKRRGTVDMHQMDIHPNPQDMRVCLIC